jgi:hypothetical protein
MELDCTSDPLIASSIPDDLDEDKICNFLDTDDDGNQLSDSMELTMGADRLDTDTDGDTYSDSVDAMPLDFSDWKDSDGDGVGDNSETIFTNMNTFVPILIAGILISGLLLVVAIRIKSKKDDK